MKETRQILRKMITILTQDNDDNDSKDNDDFEDKDGDGDIDCDDIDMKDFKVEPGDPYDLDRDGDGYACE